MWTALFDSPKDMRMQFQSEDVKALNIKGTPSRSYHKAAETGESPRGAPAAPEYIKQVYHCDVQAAGKVSSQYLGGGGRSRSRRSGLVIILRLDNWYDDDNQQEDDTQRHDGSPLF